MAVKLQVEPRLLRLKDAAAYLGVSAWKLREIIVDGYIEVVKPHQRTSAWLVDKRDLDAWIEAHKTYAYDPPREDQGLTLDQLQAHLRAIEKQLERLKVAQEEQGSIARLRAVSPR